MLNIYETTNYSQFKNFESNRDVLPNKLIESIKQKNMLKSHPIIVIKDKGRKGSFKVIDGQHRLSAAITLKTPIYYIIQEDLEEDHIPLCQVQRPWNLEDYLTFYAREKDDYQFVAHNSKEFDFKAHFIVEVSYNNPKGAFVAFRKGEFIIKKDKKILIKLFSLLRDIRDFCEPIQKSKFTKSASMAIWRLINRPDYDHEIFMHKLDVYRDQFIDAFKYQNISLIYQKLISEVYNRNTKNKKKTLEIEPVKLRLVKYTSSTKRSIN